MKIQQDHSRFRKIVRGKIREDLRKHMANGELVAKQGDKRVSIPLPQIRIPRFRHGEHEGGGVGQGDGQPGDPIAADPNGDGKPGEVGSDAGDKALELEVTIEELAEIMAEELELPNIEPRGAKALKTTTTRYTGLRQSGPESLRNFKRTYKAALKRMIATGEYDPDNPVVIPRREDKRYRSFRVDEEPVANAVIVYMMDVSGSMGDAQKEIVRIESFWIDTWLRTQYKGLESRYIIHDATAKEVDRDTFFHTRESGGTMISSAYQKCADILAADYPASEWNIYPFHFSDGDNWSVDDTVQCMRLLRDVLLPACNMFGYGQVESPYGSGQFYKDLADRFPSEDKLVLSEIKSRDAIYDSIRAFLGKGL